MNPESIYYLFEAGVEGKQEDYIWPVAGTATMNDKVFIVCDGAGSFNNGKIASKLICEFMAAKVLKFGEHKMSGELINKLLIEARDRLITYAREYRLDTDMATTFSMIILYDQKLFIAWYGDSPIYHLRGGEILFRTEDNSHVSEPTRRTAIVRGITADSSPINVETKWIEDVKDGDYFLLCSKNIKENLTDNGIKLLASQKDKVNIDLKGYFRRLAFEKTTDNYSMYLISVHVGTLERSIDSGIIPIRKQTSVNVTPLFILAMTIVGLLIMIFYFRSMRTSDSAQKYKNQTSQPADVLRDDSVPKAIVMSAPRYKPMDVKRNDSVASAIVIPPPQKPIPALTDSVNSSVIQTEEKPYQSNQLPIGQKKREAQLLLKLTTNDSCKLKITNIDLDEVIDWDISQNDNGIIYLKPGKYSIVATSMIDQSKTKTYNFNVKPGDAHTTQNLHIKF